jgi:hypothetical protein
LLETRSVRDLLDYPLGAVRSAFGNVIGWIAFLAMSCVVGIYTGACIGDGTLLPLSAIPMMIANGLLFAIFKLDIFVSICTTLGLLGLGIIWSSFRFRVATATLNTALWLTVAAWEAYYYAW